MLHVLAEKQANPRKPDLTKKWLLVTPDWVGRALRIPGGASTTIGCFALTLHENRLALLTTHHSLAARSTVQLAEDSRSNAEPVGVVGWGIRETVRFDDRAVFVDCAVVEVDERCCAPVNLRFEEEECVNAVAAGAHVHKRGAGTGVTQGVVVAVNEAAQALVDGRPHRAAGQIRIRGLVPNRHFSGAGDSGAVVRDEADAIIGLIWGVNGAGDTIVCPIAPILWGLHCRPVRLVSAAPMTSMERW